MTPWNVSFTVCLTKSLKYHRDLVDIVSCIKYIFANNIVVTKIVNIAREKWVYCLWDSREVWWSRGEVGYYAQHMSILSLVDKSTIHKTFRNAN